MRLTKETLCELPPPPINFDKLNFDVCSLYNPRQLRIRGLLNDHFGRVLRALSKPTNQDLAIKEKILAFLEGLL